MAPGDLTPTIRGLMRAAIAVDALLDRIRFELGEGFLPQKDQLRAVLAIGDTVEERVKAYIYDDILPLGQWDGAQSNFSAAALSLAQLEDALVELRRAVTWSSRFSGFNWWLRRRQHEMGVDKFTVIAGPGSCRDFRIEPGGSSVAKTFEQANLVLKLPQTRLDALAQVRILIVPQTDGASPKWHPISLGHELAHLRYNSNWVINWLSRIDPEERPAVEDAIAIARKLNDPDAASPTIERWFENLSSWLVETSCDAAMYAFYGPHSVDALAAYLSVHSVTGDGLEHPAPGPRLAALRATTPTDLDEYKVPAGSATLDKQRRNSYCDLAVEIRDGVLADLGHESSIRPEQVIALARTSLDHDWTPCADDWESSWYKDHPSSVEAGLVGTLWALDAEEDLVARPTNRTLHELNERRIAHAVDFLQFLHRFEARRVAEGIDTPDEGSAPTNVLFISENGVTRRPSPGIAGTETELPTPESAAVDTSLLQGDAAHDVRLGRHFIVFRRNQIATLNSLDAEGHSRQIQEAVEIGWGDTFVLHPSEMVLAVTLESMVMAENCTAQVLSRSSLGRMGLLSATAVQVQPGFRGCLTLELVNLASVPLVLSPGQRVAQIVPAMAVGAKKPYGGKYQNQDWKPRFSAVVNDWEMPILKKLDGVPSNAEVSGNDTSEATEGDTST